MMRTSESKGHYQLYDSSAALEPEVRNRTCRTMCANFGFAALEPLVAVQLAAVDVDDLAAHPACALRCEKQYDIGDLFRRRCPLERHVVGQDLAPTRSVAQDFLR